MPPDMQRLLAELQQAYPEGVPLVQGLPPAEAQVLLQIYAQTGIQGVIQLLQQFAQAMSGGQGLPPGQPGIPQPTPDVPPGLPQGPPQGLAPQGPALPPGAPGSPQGLPLPPQVSVGNMPTPPPPGAPQGQPGPSAPSAPPKPQLPPGPKPRPQREVPKYNLPALPDSPFKGKAPTYARVLEDARIGREVWLQRDNRISADTEMYYLTYDTEALGNVEANDLNQSIVHRRSQPAVLVDRITGLTTAENDRLTIEVLRRADDDVHKTAAQMYENWARTMRELDEEKWDEKAQYGDPRPPMARTEAGLMTLQGGVGWAWRVQPDDEEHPFRCDIVPWGELYPLGHATTRQFVMPLTQARGLYKEIDEYYPLGQTQEDRGGRWHESMDVRIICWSDAYGLWHAIAWEEAPVGGSSPQRGTVDNDAEGGLWIKKPSPMDYGFCYYQSRIWGGTPSGALLSNRSQHRAFVGYGVLTMLRKTFRLLDLLVSAIASGTLRLQNPATLHTVSQGQDMTKVEEINLEPGARNYGFEGEEVKPLVFGVTGGPDGENFLRSLMAEVADITPTAPAGQASGLSHYQAAEAAGQLMVAPIINSLERCYQDMIRQRGMLALRYSSASQDAKNLYTEYSYRGHRGSDRGVWGELTPDDIRTAGVRAQVRYKRLSDTERANLANMVTGLVNNHLMSQEAALGELGVQEPEREMQRILQDSALLDKSVLKALVESAIMDGGNESLKAAWQSVKMENMMAGQQGSQPAPAGVPSPAGQPGVPAPGVPAEFSNIQQMMQGQAA